MGIEDGVIIGAGVQAINHAGSGEQDMRELFYHDENGRWKVQIHRRSVGRKMRSETG